MKKPIIILLIAISSILLISSGMWLSSRSDDSKEESSSTSNIPTDLSAEKSATYQKYEALVGEEYDRSFISDMIAHHQGAVDMAELALSNAKHDELKDMANKIISDQESEISQMKTWQKEWEYPISTGDDMVDHSAMGMENQMSNMMIELEDKKGDDFDRSFIKQMILHHQSAIDMASPGEKNAQHQELKDLTKEVVSAQTKEIKQMEQWRKDWGYVTE